MYVRTSKPQKALLLPNVNNFYSMSLKGQADNAAGRWLCYKVNKKSALAKIIVESFANEW